MKFRRMVLVTLILFAIVPSLLVAGLCTLNFSQRSMDLVKQNIETTAEVQAHNIDNFLTQRQINIEVTGRLQMLQEYLMDSNRGEWNSEDDTYQALVNDVLTTRVEIQPYLMRFSLVNRNNVIIACNEKDRVGMKSLIPAESLAAIQRGEPVVTDLLSTPDYKDGMPHFVICQPVIIDGEFEGYLLYVMNMLFFEDMVTSTDFFETGRLTIVDGGGVVMATSSAYYEEMDNIFEDEGPLGDEIRGIDLNTESQGMVEYSLDGEARMGYYARVPGTSWMVISVVDRAEFVTPIGRTIWTVVGLVALVVLLSVIVYRLVARYFSRPLGLLPEAIRRLQGGDMDSRVAYDKNDEFGEIGRAFNELIEKIKADRRELLIKEERYRVIVEQSEGIIFEYNIEEGTFFREPGFEKKFGYKLDLSQLADGGGSMIHPDDCEAFRAFLKEVKKKEGHGITLRIRKADGSYIWCDVWVTTIFDDGGKPVKAVGRILDIDERKRVTDELVARAQRDSMTDLYNKATAETFIKDVLDHSGERDVHALFAIDVDNFKFVNDTYGHLYGDAVLKEVGGGIGSIFRGTDVVGRIGGDEFVVFMKNVKSEAMVEEKAKALAQIFHRISAGASDFSVTGSVGVSVYSRDGRDFKTLFKAADRALYAAKNHGKDRYEIFSEATADHYVIQMEARPDGERSMTAGSVTEYIFQVLYESRDIDKAVPIILDIVGRTFNVSRAYVFENSDDDSCCNNTFEWCNEGIPPQIDQLQRVPYSELADYAANFNEDNIFYCSDIKELPEEVYRILAPQGIHSMLQCAILDDGRFKGYVGFDECSENRLWTKDEVETLSFIAKILSTFLIKTRISRRLERSYAMTRSVLDTQDMWTYVVDRATYELHFINRKTHELTPEAKLGERCYEAFFGREGPCERCPIRDLGAARERCTLEIYNPVFRVWTRATGSLLSWQGKENMALLCCTDISEYKREPGKPARGR